jgi:hypothetical protein
LIYLLGAGASHPALPLASGVPVGMQKWGAKLAGEARPVFQDSPAKDAVLEMAAELTKWGEAASYHYSIDTLAKKLYLLGRHAELWQLKAAMSAFFMLEQSASQAEQRYDSFFAALLERPGNPPVLPETVGILTWNYDRQLERAYHQYCPDWHRVQENITFSPQVIRLNGLLGRAIDKGTGDEYNLSFERDERGVYERVSREFQELRSHSPTMRFAFEETGRQLDAVRSLASKADTVVVIGYSFPFFNRRDDRLILDAMPDIKRVFIQVLPEHAKAIEMRMRSLRDSPEVQLIDDQTLFFVPHDF